MAQPYKDSFGILLKKWQSAMPPELRTDFAKWWEDEGILLVKELQKQDERKRSQAKLRGYIFHQDSGFKFKVFNQVVRQSQAYQSLKEQLVSLPNIGEKKTHFLLSEPTRWSENFRLIMEHPTVMRMAFNESPLTKQDVQALRAWGKSWS